MKISVFWSKLILGPESRSVKWTVNLVDIKIFQKPFLNMHIFGWIVSVQNLKGLSLL